MTTQEEAPATEPGSRVRIGELSRRTGVSDHVLRAWERRYGLLDPTRSDGGFRLYSATDELRVRRMVQLLDRGLSPAEAARDALAPVSPEELVAPAQPARDVPSADGALEGGIRARVWEALSSAVSALDESSAQQAVDELFAALTVEAAVRDVVMPFLYDLGERWGRGEVSVAQEHFVSQLLRGRLAALARGSARPSGPRAVLACPPGERHDIALLAFALVLRRQGWVVTFLGADTPVDSLTDLLDGRSVEAVVLAASEEARFLDVADALRGVAARTRMYLAGAGATDATALSTGASLLEGDPVTAAVHLAANLQPG